MFNLYRGNYLVILCLTIMLANSFSLYSQSRLLNEVRVDTTKLISFDELAPLIEKKHNIKLYFKTEWFATRKFRESLVQLPLDNFITAVKRISELNCIEINHQFYVFVPVEVKNYSNKINSKGVVLVGEGYNPEIEKNVKLTGRIINAETGKPLNGAKLIVDKLNKTVTTDKNGLYVMTVPTGEYQIRFLYADFDENVKMIRIGGDGIVDFELARKSILLKEVVITDKVADLNVIRTQMSLVKFNSKTIKDLPLFLGEKDIVKSLTLLPGVQSTGEFGTGFFVRGGGADQNLILLEDVPLFNSSHMFGLTSVVNPDCVNNISFIKAGIPAKYGERASSVMDIHFGSNPEKISFKGGIGLLNTRLNLEVPLFNRKASLLLGGRNSYSSWLLHSMPDVELKNSSAEFYDLNLLYTMKLDTKNSIALFGYLSKDNFGFSQSTTYDYDNSMFSLRYNHTFSEKLNSSFLIGYSGYTNNVAELDSLKPKDAYKINSSINYNNLKINFSWKPTEKHNVEFGLNSAFYRLQPGKLIPLGALSDMESITTQRENALESSIFISDDFSIKTDLSVELGLRLNNFTYLGADLKSLFNQNYEVDTDESLDNAIGGYFNAEPRLSFRYSIDNKSSLKWSYNRVNQYINLISNTTVMAPTDVYKLSSGSVKPLMSDQVAIGYFRNLFNNTMETSVELYYKKLNNITEYRDGARILLNNSIESDLLRAIGYNYGIEFLIKRNVGKLTGWASYTFSRSMRRTTSTNELDQINNNKYYPSSFDKPHNLVIVANYNATKRWRFSGNFMYNSGKPLTLPELKYEFGGKQYIYYSERNKYRLPDYHRLDLSITHDQSLKIKQKWKGSWTFSLLNVYGRKNPYSVFYKSNSKLESFFNESFNLYNLYIIAKPIPTLTYNFSF